MDKALATKHKTPPNLWTLTPLSEAAMAGLVYAHVDTPGYTRVRRGRAVHYLCPRGRKVLSQRLITRFNALVIPPAWREVWICADIRGHIQATGLDQRGRKQYRYHPQWRAQRDGTKFSRMLEFGRSLPTLRAQVQADLKASALSKQQIMAAVVTLLETTLIRIGNEAYARSNKSFGLTTIRTKHAAIDHGAIKFHFKGKSGVVHDVTLHHAKLASIIARCQDLPGQLLFQYLDEAGQAHRLTSCDINNYLRELTGHAFSAKDFRTWNGSVLALATLQAFDPPTSDRQAKMSTNKAVAQVAERLRNTVAVCRKSYIHPHIFTAYSAGHLAAPARHLGPPFKRRLTSYQRIGLAAEEAALMALLECRK